MRHWAQLAAMLEKGPVAVLSVSRVAGSAPREAGARMMLGADGEQAGTIGGGALEWNMMQAARDMLALGQPQARLYPLQLGPELAQCCGGRADVLVELFDQKSLQLV
ncbi:MAG: XdhC family protein, partial [Pseudomonadota bacterium]